MCDERTEVLIVGGGLVGLSAAVFLRQQGVAVTLAERHASTSFLPRGRMVNSRSMEIFRTAGLEPAIRTAPSSVFRDFDQNARAETLAGPEHFLGVRPAAETVDGLSPCPPALIDQNTLEPLVRARAEELGADVRFSTDVVSFEQGDDRVTAVLHDRVTGARRNTAASFLIAADGHRASIRHRLEIPVTGPGTLAHVASIVFRADLGKPLRGRLLGLCYLQQPRPGTLLTPFDRSGRWVLMLPYFPDQGERVSDFTPARCLEFVRRAIGVPGLAATIDPATPDAAQTVHTWELAAHVATRYRDHRVYLVGDAAHVMPPAGGFGANTGIQDAHNLAWKLAVTLRGEAGPGLLASYEVERRPVARLACEQALARQDGRAQARGDQGLIDPLSAALGYRYRSSAVANEGDGGPLIQSARDLAGRPGTRAPHLRLDRDGREISTIDLCTDRFVLLAGPDGTGWAAAAQAAARSLGVSMKICRLGRDAGDVEHRWTKAYGVDQKGAALIRPDGFVAWRTSGGVDGPAEILESVLARVLSRSC